MTAEELAQQREDLKKYIKRSIFNEDLNFDDQVNRATYKYLYDSKHKNVTGIAGVRNGSVNDNPQYMRTESFQENLDYTEFKKEQMSKKKAMKLSTTQKIFNRKDIFSKKKAPPQQGLRETAPKEDMQQMRRAEMQQKAKERKQRLDNDDFLKLNRDQMINNVCQVIFKHIEAAETYIEEPT